MLIILSAGCSCTVSKSTNKECNISSSVKQSHPDCKEFRVFNAGLGKFSFMRLSPDSKKLFTARFDHPASVWDIETGVKLYDLPEKTHNINIANFSPNSKQLITAIFDGIIQVWDVDTGSELYAFENRDCIAGTAVFSPDGKLVLISWGSNDPTAYIYDASNGKIVHSLTGHSRPLVSETVSFSPDGKWIMTASYDRTVKIWDVNTGKELYQLDASEYSAVKPTFSPDSQKILMEESVHSKNVSIWDIDTGKKIHTFAGCESHGLKLGIDKAVFSPDGKKLLVRNLCCFAKILDIDTGKELQVFNDRSSPSITVGNFSPDGQLVVLGCDYDIFLWTVTDGGMLSLKENRGCVHSADFSSDGLLLIEGNNDKTVRIWEVKTGKKLCEIGGQEPVSRVCFLHNDDLILAFDKYTVRIWNIKTLKISSDK